MSRRNKARLTITLFSNNEVKIGAESLWPVIVIILIGRLAALDLESTQIAEFFRLIISKLHGF